MDYLRWKVGDRVEAKDFMNVWYPSKVVAYDDKEDAILVHFEGWNQRFDEWFPSNSDKLRPLRKSFRESLKSSTQLLKVGQHVSAPWKDGESYPGRIKNINFKQRKYEVSFLDGATRHVSFKDVRVMTDEEIKELNYNLGTSDIMSISTDSNSIQDGEMLGWLDKHSNNFDRSYPIGEELTVKASQLHTTSSLEYSALVDRLDDKVQSRPFSNFCLICGKDVSQNKNQQNPTEPQVHQSGVLPCFNNEHLLIPKWLQFMDSLNSLQKMLKNNEQKVKLVKNKLSDEGGQADVHFDCKIIKNDQRFMEDTINKIEKLVDDLAETCGESDQ